MSLPESLHASRSISVGDVLSGTVFPHEDCSLLDHRHHGRIPSREFRNETDSIVQLGSDKRHVVKRLAWDVYHFAHVLLKRSTCGANHLGAEPLGWSGERQSTSRVFANNFIEIGLSVGAGLRWEVASQQWIDHVRL
ncbi:unnamed protein product [Lampetra fluviatilis]